jgi:hypothetical protein
MDPKLQEAKDNALAQGWEIEAVPLGNATAYQLKNPEGKYVQFGGTEESVWRHALERGILPKKQS